MKALNILFIWLIFLGCNPKTPTEDNPSIEKKLYTLLQQGEFFKLKTEAKKSEAVLPADKLIFFQAFIESAFNHGLKCEKAYGKLLGH